MEESALKKWQKHARNELELLSETLMAALDVAVAKEINKDQSFSVKLKLVRDSGGRSLFELEHLASFDGEKFHQWLKGENLPAIRMQEDIIQFCVKAIHEARKDVSALEYVIGLVKMEEDKLNSVKTEPVWTQATTSDQHLLLFDPWTDVAKLDLSPRSLSCVLDNDVRYLGQLVLLKEKTLLARPNFGTKSAEEVKFILSTKGAYLGMTHPDLDTFIADLKAGKTKTEKI